MSIFSEDNTEGYTAEQLALANKLIGTWLDNEEVGEDESLWLNEYKQEKERVLQLVERLDA